MQSNILFAYNPGYFRKERFWDWSNSPAPCFGTESCLTLRLFLKEGCDFYKSCYRSWTRSLPCFLLIFSKAPRLANIEEEGKDWKHGLSSSMRSVAVPALSLRCLLLESCKGAQSKCSATLADSAWSTRGLLELFLESHTWANPATQGCTCVNDISYISTWPQQDPDP